MEPAGGQASQLGAMRGLGLAAVLLLLAACGRAPSEEQLRAQVDGLREAIIARDAAGVAGHLAEDFIGPDGMDRAQARRLAAAMFLRYPHIGLRTGPLTVELQDDGRRAVVRFTAAATGGAGGLLPESGRLRQVSTGWRVDGGEWKLASARWEPES